MEQEEIKEILKKSIEDFHLPRYEEIPDVGLYLDQTTTFISGYLKPLEGVSITGSMISNYVKKKLVTNPVRRRYDRIQIGYLVFIALAKTVLSLEDIQLLIDIQKRSYDRRTAYEYFCREFENTLYYVFGLRDSLKEVGQENTGEKTILRNTIIAIAHKVYLDKYFALVRKGEIGG